MESPRLLKRTGGYVLLEACFALGLLIAAASYVLRTNRAAISNSSFALSSMLVDNLLENYAAAVKAGHIRTDGSLVLPACVQAVPFNTAAATTQRVVLAPNSAFTADLTTYRRDAGTSEGVRLVEFVIEARYSRKIVVEGSTQTYLKSRTVLRNIPL